MEFVVELASYPFIIAIILVPVLMALYDWLDKYFNLSNRD